MSSKPAPAVVGRGAPELDLAPAELRAIVEQALLSIAPGARVLAIIPDKTRDDNTDLLFPFAAEILAARRFAQFDALVALENVIGRVETPTRHKIEAAAEFEPARIISLNTVVTRADDNRLSTHALFAGDIRQAFRRAAEVSRQAHIKYTGRKFKRVVALLDEHYDELWVGGKASYKLGGIIEAGGELLIYAPHLRAISETHGLLIEKYGYAPLDRVREMVALSTELQANLAVAAHLAHVSYAGKRDEQGRVIPRYKITMASALDEETCRRVHLGFMDHREFKREDYDDDTDTLVVERAGRDLYLVQPH